MIIYGHGHRFTDRGLDGNRSRGRSCELFLLEKWNESLIAVAQKVYKAYIHTSLDSDTKVPILLKHRFKKQYRHPSLDANLTRARVAGEARALLRSLRCVCPVPPQSRWVTERSQIRRQRPRYPYGGCHGRRAWH